MASVTLSLMAVSYTHLSTNDTKQDFHLSDANRVEVFDNRSDVVVYDVEKHEIVTAPHLSSEANKMCIRDRLGYERESETHVQQRVYEKTKLQCSRDVVRPRICRT